MKIKDFTVETELHSRLTSLLFTLDAIYRNWGSELIITSGSEESTRHGFTSLHYATPSQAVDIRVWSTANVPNAKTQHSVIVATKDKYCVAHKLPSNWFDVILESNHIHIEYQPKRKDIS